MSSTNERPRGAPRHSLSFCGGSRRRTAPPHPAVARAGTARQAEAAHPRPAGLLAPFLLWGAAVACTADQRNKLERLARYVARPAIALKRLTVDSAGHVVLEPTHPFRDGTTHMLFRHADWPEDWLARLAALVPRARAHLTRYRGVFAPNCRLRRRVVPSPRGAAARTRQQGKGPEASSPPNPPTLNDDGLPLAPMTWTESRVTANSSASSRSTSPPAPTAVAHCDGLRGTAFGGPPSGGRLRGAAFGRDSARGDPQDAASREITRPSTANYRAGTSAALTPRSHLPAESLRRPARKPVADQHAM